MSTPITGWIARNGEVERLRAERDELRASADLRWKADMRAIERWREATGKTLTFPDHADLCMWLMGENDKLRERLRLGAMQTELESARSELTEAKSLLRSAIDALTHAFTFEDVPLSQHQHEMENGRWDGVRGIVEQGEQFLEGYTGELERVRAERDDAMHMIDHLVGYLKLLPNACEGEYAAAEEMLEEYDALNDTEEER